MASTPSIRFDGFSDPWEQRKPSELFDAIANNSFSRADMSFDIGAVKNIHYGDILVKYGVIVDVSSNDIPRIAKSKPGDFTKSLLKDGAVIFADAAEDETVGKVIEIAGSEAAPVVSGLHTIACRPKRFFSPSFMGYCLNAPSFRRQLLSLMQGTKVLSISRRTLEETVVKFPHSLDEQARIASVLTSLDSLITLHQRKHDKLRVVKKSMLEKMFPKPGYDVPEIRFNGFSDPWEQRKLNDLVGNITTGKLDANAAVENGKYPFFTTAIQTYQIDTYSFDADAILVAGNGPIGYVKEYNGKFDAYQREYVITDFSNSVKSFIVVAMKKAMPERIATATYGSAMPYITLDVLSEMLLSVPESVDEQTKVANFFRNLDSLITLYQRKLELLRSVKKSLLSKMFV